MFECLFQIIIDNRYVVRRCVAIDAFPKGGFHAQPGHGGIDYVARSAALIGPARFKVGRQQETAITPGSTLCIRPRPALNVGHGDFALIVRGLGFSDAGAYRLPLYILASISS